MLYRKCNIQDLEKALDIINKKYQGNITFNRLDNKGFTLKCKDSKKPGHRRGYSGRRLISACWHVHGDFFDALFEIKPEAIIISLGEKITRFYGNWQDRNIGSMMYPLYLSEACDC